MKDALHPGGKGSIVDRRWNLTGKVALVTGGTRGIGRAVVADLLGKGAETILVARDRREVEAQVASWRRRKLKAHGIVADVSLPEGRESALAQLERLGDRLDILVNNVGMNIRKKVVSYSSGEYEQLIATNLTSVFEMCRLTHSLLKAAGGGAVVNVASVAGLTALRDMAVYGMTKAALIQLTKNLAVEWAPDGIRVNAVAPWYVRTSLTEAVLRKKTYLAEVLRRTPLHRLCEPEEAAAAVSFLCLPAASYVNGQCIVVDGGFLANGF